MRKAIHSAEPNGWPFSSQPTLQRRQKCLLKMCRITSAQKHEQSPRLVLDERHHKCNGQGEQARKYPRVWVEWHAPLAQLLAGACAAGTRWAVPRHKRRDVDRYY